MRINPILNNFKRSLVFGYEISRKNCIGAKRKEFQNIKPDYKEDDFKYPKYATGSDFVTLKSRSKDGVLNLAGEIHREKISDDEVLYAISKQYTDEPLGYLILSLDVKNMNSMQNIVPEHLKEYFSDAPYIKKMFSYKGGTNPDISGVGTHLVKCALKESIKTGHDGKLSVLACNPKDPFCAPTIFYHKLGFKFIEDDKEDIINKLEEEGNLNMQSALDNSINIGTMYLPKENIEKLLNC